MKNIQKSLSLIILSLCVLLNSCSRQKKDNSDSSASQNLSQSTLLTNNQSTLDLAIKDEPPLPNSALSQLPSVQETLEKMIYAYKTLDSYTDQAICQITIRQGDNVINQSSPFFFSFIKPNKMRYVSRTCEIRANGKTISVFIPSLPGVILQRPCPKEIHLEDLLFDQAIDEAVFLSQPSVFTVLPLQWLVLFAEDPLKTLTFGYKDIYPLAPREINGRPCYRLRFDREDGTAAILWIDQKTGLLLRAQLPPQLQVSSIEGASVEDCSVTVEFCDPQINVAIPDVAFAMEIPVGTNVTDNYIPPTTELLGKKFPDFQFNKLGAAGTVDSSALKGKIAIINLWTTWSKLEPSVQPLLNQLRQQYKNDEDVVFLSVSVDEPSVSDASLRDALTQWGSPLNCVRDESGFLSQELKVNAVPAVFVLNKNGVIENLEMGFNPLLVNEISSCIDQIKNGESPNKTILKNKQAELQQYEQHRKEWIDRDIFVDVDVIQQAGIPENAPAQTSQPRQFELKLLWEIDDIQNPGGLLAEDGEADLGSRQEAVGSSDSPAANLDPTASNGCVWVIENGKKVVQIDSEGHIKSRIDLALDPKEICSFIRKSSTATQEGSRQEAVGSSKDASKRPTGADIGSRAAARTGSGASPPSEACFLAFAPGQQRVHVYDQNWKNLFHYPENALENPHDGIQDARFGKLSSGNNDEIYIGYLGTSGAQSIDLNGRLRWSNRSLGTVFSIAPYNNQNEKLVLCCAGSSGMITVLTEDGKTMGDKNNIGVIGLKDNLAAMVYSAKLKKGSTPDAPVNDSLCALCANQNSYLLAGFNLRSEILWTYELPQGIPKRPIDYLTSAEIMPNGDAVWIALGSDGSIHFIDGDGILIDSFNHGQFVYGLSVANWNGKRVLILSDDQGVKAYQLIWK